MIFYAHLCMDGVYVRKRKRERERREERPVYMQGVRHLRRAGTVEPSIYTYTCT